MRFLLFPITGKKKKKRGVSFVDWKSFKTNKRVILFYRELTSRSKNLNQRKSRSLLESRRHFNVFLKKKEKKEGISM